MTKLHPSLKQFDAILRSIISPKPPDLLRIWVEKRSRRRRRRTASLELVRVSPTPTPSEAMAEEAETRSAEGSGSGWAARFLRHPRAERPAGARRNQAAWLWSVKG